MNPEKMFELQNQMRQNQADLTSYLRELDDWENDMKKKEASLKMPSSSGGEVRPDYMHGSLLITGDGGNFTYLCGKRLRLSIKKLFR